MEESDACVSPFKDVARMATVRSNVKTATKTTPGFQEAKAAKCAEFERLKGLVEESFRKQLQAKSHEQEQLVFRFMDGEEQYTFTFSRSNETFILIGIDINIPSQGSSIPAIHLSFPDLDFGDDSMSLMYNQGQKYKSANIDTLKRGFEKSVWILKIISNIVSFDRSTLIASLRKELNKHLLFNRKGGKRGGDSYMRTGEKVVLRKWGQRTVYTNARGTKFVRVDGAYQRLSSLKSMTLAKQK